MAEPWTPRKRSGARVRPWTNESGLVRRSPPALRGRPVVGHLFDLRRAPLDVLSRAAKAGDIVSLRLGHQRVYLLNHPDHIKRVLQDRPERFGKSNLVGRLKALLGEGLLTSEGDLWRQQRRLVQPLFQRRQLLGMSDVMAETAASMAERWRGAAGSDRQLDIADEMSHVAVETLARVMFGVSIDERVPEIRQAMEELHRALNQRIWAMIALPLWIPSPANLRFRRLRRPLEQIVHGIIEDSRAEEGDSNNLLQRLLAARDPESGTGMSARQLRDEVMTMLTAGHETTAVALTWFWYLLARHPEVERKVRHEALAVLGGRPPGAEDLARLSYLRMAMYESLRLLPAVWWFSRVCKQDEEIGGYFFPAGSTFILSQYTMNRHAGFWDRPEAFDPERFAPDRSRDRPHFAFFPFGGGPRVCIGNNLALLEFMTIAATVVQRYRLELPPGYEVSFDPMISLRPRGGLPMKVVPVRPNRPPAPPGPVERAEEPELAGCPLH